jgi:hypothetical protein
VVDPATGDSLGIDVQTVANGLPQAFAVPYIITDVDPAKDYVVTAEVVDSGQSWRNDAGVPVLTKGSPKTAVQVVVTPVVGLLSDRYGRKPALIVLAVLSAALPITLRAQTSGQVILNGIIGAIARPRPWLGRCAGAAAGAAGTAGATQATRPRPGGAKEQP